MSRTGAASSAGESTGLSAMERRLADMAIRGANWRSWVAVHKLRVCCHICHPTVVSSPSFDAEQKLLVRRNRCRSLRETRFSELPPWGHAQGSQQSELPALL
eukprot:2475159-Rhodomonas_salina.1